MKGFTTVELLVTISIMAITMSLAAPGFSQQIANTRLKKVEGDMASSIQRAVSESKKQRKRIVLCARSTDTSCGADWSNGWLIFVDENATGTRQSLDTDETVLRVRGATAYPGLAIGVSTRAPWSSTTVSASTLSVEPRGRSSAATIIFCDKRGVDESLSMALLPSGLPTYDLAKNTAGNSIDLWGNVVSCPI